MEMREPLGRTLGNADALVEDFGYLGAQLSDVKPQGLIVLRCSDPISRVVAIVCWYSLNSHSIKCIDISNHPRLHSIAMFRYHRIN